MEITELMIGDYVKIKDLKDPVKWIFGIDGFFNKVYYLDGEDLLFTSVDNVLPIPLTEKILKKNGFRFGYTTSEEDFCNAVGCEYPDEKGWCYDEGTGEIKIIFPNESDGGIIRLDDQDADKHLELTFVNPIMVHELQHALRLCGVDEDFKL